MSESGGQHAGLAGAGAGQHEQWAIKRFDRLALFLVQWCEIIRHGRNPLEGVDLEDRGSIRKTMSQTWSPANVLVSVGCPGAPGGPIPPAAADVARSEAGANQASGMQLTIVSMLLDCAF